MRITEGGDVQWGTSGVPAMTWDASASSLGIGTSAPDDVLHVATGGIRVDGTPDESSSTNSLGMGVISSVPTIFTLNSADLAFKTAGAERMRITSDGAIGLGGANYGTSGQVLTSAGSSAVPTWETAAGGGKVLQVLNNTATVADASATSATAAVSQAITPAADSNTVLVTATANFSLDYDDINVETGDMRWQLFRGGTAIGNQQKYVNNNDQMTWSYNSLYYCCSFTFKDSPATASAVTYSLKYYQANTTGPVAVVYDAQITVQEID